MASTMLNPNAPIFVPQAFRTVEDFSDQWWNLIHSTPWFRDYWLQECFHDPQPDGDFLHDDDADAFPDDLLDSFFFDEASAADYNNTYFTSGDEEEVRDHDQYCRDMVRYGAKRWQKGAAQAPRFADKAPKLVNVKVSPRTIQQPR